MKNILITGASGYLGSLLLEDLEKNKESLGIQNLVACDVRPLRLRSEKVIFENLDVRDVALVDVLKKYKIDCVVHLASIVTPGKKSNREFEYSVDVLGSKNVLHACVEAKTKRVVISSSGAAYGYYPENINLLKEDDPIRGNFEFAYSHHKKLVEEECARYRQSHPELEQTIFRICTILGENVNNQITDLFKQPIQIGVSGSDTAFSFIWDKDAVRAFKEAIFSSKCGIFNLAGDGVVKIDERAKILKKKVVYLPSDLISKTLGVLKKYSLTQYGPEQILFLKYRPMLDNKRLKEVFGFKPEKTSLEVFKFYVEKMK